MEDSLSVLLGASIGIILVLVFIVIAFCIVYIVALAKLFKKAGEDGWKAIIPFYNTYVLIKIAGLNWWYFLIAISGTIVSFLDIDGLDAICTLASIATNFFIFYNLAKKMHQNPVAYGIGSIFVSPILTMVLGFSSKYTFDSTVKVSPNGPIGAEEEPTPTSPNTEPAKYCTSCGSKISQDTKFCPNCGREA